MIELDLRAAAATNSGFVKNSAEILQDARAAIERLLAEPFMPEDTENG